MKIDIDDGIKYVIENFINPQQKRIKFDSINDVCCRKNECLLLNELSVFLKNFSNAENLKEES